METIKVNLQDKQEEIKMAKRDEFFKKMELMFDYKSKLSSMVNSEKLKNYKEVYFSLFEKVQSGKLPSHPDYFGDNVLAKNIYERKYFLKDLNSKIPIEEKAEDVYMRLASYVACIEDTYELREKFAERFYLDLYDGYYLPGGRVLAGAGDLYRLKTLANCFVSTIDADNLESIYKSAYEAARTYSYGGGIGIDMTQLRPKDSRVHNAADQSTGAVSFMDLYSLTTGLIGQSGRRGALMLTIDIKHPDILDFINVKKDSNWITNQIIDRLNMSGIYNDEQIEIAKKNIIENTQIRFANISIKVSDEFMSAVEEQKKFGKDKILIYKKLDKTGPVKGISSDNYNYSYGMSKKDLKNYVLEEQFNTIDELNLYLIENNFEQINIDFLNNLENRDYYGDLVISSQKLDYDLAIRYSGDFVTYYKSKSVGELKFLHKARDIWN
ncbi:ribonucleoside-diphosphate reductase, adenosylcobalamin-dependent, partial [bacterium]|nr:ribonucleoside-diphosphate reductase, adenosylcobalamin-dependent [bacterium]